MDSSEIRSLRAEAEKFETQEETSENVLFREKIGNEFHSSERRFEKSKKYFAEIK